MGKRKDDEDRMRQLREDPDYQALLRSLREQSQDQKDRFFDEYDQGGADYEHDD